MSAIPRILQNFSKTGSFLVSRRGLKAVHMRPFSQPTSSTLSVWTEAQAEGVPLQLSHLRYPIAFICPLDTQSIISNAAGGCVTQQANIRCFIGIIATAQQIRVFTA